MRPIMRTLSVVLCLGMFSACEARPDEQDSPVANQPPAVAKRVDPAPPQVQVSRPVEREVTDFIDMTGRTEPNQRVDLRSRVTGYLVKSLVEEGSDVKKGDLLFEIDSRPYQAILDRSLARVQVAEAQLNGAAAAAARVRANVQTAGAQGLDEATAAAAKARAELAAARATAKADQLNLEFTQIRAPIDGRFGRCLLDVGSLVNADASTLGALFSTEPMYVFFDMDEKSFLTLRALPAGKAILDAKTKSPILMGLANESGYPRKGVVNFVDPRVNPDTGTVRCRAVFPNPGAKILPGMFARVRLPVDEPHKALLISEAAIGSDQGLHFVYVVDDKNVVQHRRVELGAAQSDRLRVINRGLKPTDRVLVSGLKEVQPSLTVQPIEVAMPTGVPK
jgi:RND family efflux transporter MFP subunit